MVETIKSTDIFEKIYRGLAKPIVNMLKDTFVTGNMVTVFRALLFIPFCILLAVYPLFYLPSWFVYIIAAIGIQFWDTLDCVDGGLARAKNQASELGEWLEYCIDRPIGGLAGLFGFCLAFGLYLKTQSIWPLVFIFFIAAGWYLKTEFVNIKINEEWRLDAREAKKSALGNILFFFHYRELQIFSIYAFVIVPIFGMFDPFIMTSYLLFYALLHNTIWVGMAFVQYTSIRRRG